MDHPRPAAERPALWRAIEALAAQVMADLVEQPLDGPRARRQALDTATRELATALAALETTHTRLLVQQDHLATLGRLAAGLAHELRTPLGVLHGGLDLLERELATRPPDETAWLRRHLERLQKATALAVQITSSVSAASKPPRPGRQRVDVETLLETTRELVTPLARSQRARVAVGLDPGLEVRGDRSQLLQVLLNLATNALEAMAGPGTLSLRAWRDRAAVTLEVADTGPGIPPAIQDRIFEPFFTTKANGTGLGLAITRELVDAHGGTLTLISQPGAGTTARIRLPASSPGDPNPAQAPASPFTVP